MKTSCNDINQEIDIFVPKEDGVKVNILSLKNLSTKKKKLKLVYYIKPVLRRRRNRVKRVYRSGERIKSYNRKK